MATTERRDVPMRPRIRRTWARGSNRAQSSYVNLFSTQRLRSWPARAFAVLLLLGALALGARFGLALRGQATGEPSGADVLDALLARSSVAVAFSEFGVGSDTLWAANPADPTDRVLLGTAPHAPGFSVFPSLSPDGAHVAYTALPAGSSDSLSGSTAQLWLLDVASGATRLLAGGIDLRSAPVWSPASDAVVVRRNTGSEGGASGELLRIDLSGSAETVAAQAAGLYPIDFSPDGGALYYATLSASGTDLMRATVSAAGAAGAPQPVAHLSDGIARNWRLSPDGKQLAYLAAAPAGAPTAYVVQVLDLATAAVQTPLGDAAGAQFNPIWDRNETITVGRVSDSERAALRFSVDGSARLTTSGSRAAGAPLPAPATGFDLPLSWSPNGAYLIVRTFEGASPADPGPSHVVAVDAAGQRRPLSPQSDVEIAGWLEAAP
jgi:Tol biopolymer transport system component